MVTVSPQGRAAFVAKWRVKRCWPTESPFLSPNFLNLSSLFFVFLRGLRALCGSISFLERKNPMFPTSRSNAVIQTTIANGTALSAAISMADFDAGSVITPAAWTAAAIAFKVCDTFGGTFVPLRGATGAVLEITNVVASGAFPLPAELHTCQYFKIWSETAGAGTDTNQAADRIMTVMLKS
jgi:hypothetical protein